MKSVLSKDEKSHPLQLQHAQITESHIVLHMHRRLLSPIY
jgi:hypothetical protein